MLKFRLLCAGIRKAREDFHKSYYNHVKERHEKRLKGLKESIGFRVHTLIDGSKVETSAHGAHNLNQLIELEREINALKAKENN